MNLLYPKVYLAAAFDRQSEMLDHAAELRGLGIVVTSRWLTEDAALYAKLGPGGTAQMDLEDLDESDCIIAFTEPPADYDVLHHLFSQDWNPRGGRHVEFGYALAKGKQLYVVGYRENIFHNVPQVKFYPTWDLLMDEAYREVR